MHIIIDGYNLLKQIIKSDTISEKERGWFALQAAEYARRKKHSIIIVYDGGSSARSTSQKKGDLVTVYSGWKMSADDVIKAYIDENLLHDMLIVTTDRQINAYATRVGIPSIDSIDFFRIMREMPLEEKPIGFKRVPGAAHKLHEGEGSEDIDALMQEGSSILQYKNEEETEPHLEKASQRTSKKERLAAEILKKL